MKSNVWWMQLVRAHEDKNTETDKSRCLKGAASFS
jgi:hypothetical protein